MKFGCRITGAPPTREQLTEFGDSSRQLHVAVEVGIRCVGIPMFFPLSPRFFWMEPDAQSSTVLQPTNGRPQPLHLPPVYSAAPPPLPMPLLLNPFHLTAKVDPKKGAVASNAMPLTGDWGCDLLRMCYDNVSQSVFWTETKIAPPFGLQLTEIADKRTPPHHLQVHPGRR